MNGWLPPLRDLVIALVVGATGYVLLLALAHLLGRWRGVRFSAGYHLFALAAGLLAGVHLSAWPAP